MGILEILILVALAVIIFIVIRRLPDAMPKPSRNKNAIKGKGSPNKILENVKSFIGGLVGMIFEGIQSFRSKIRKPKQSSKKKIQTPEMASAQHLKKPEDRDFWVDEEGNKNGFKPDLIARTYFEEAEAAFKIKDYRRAETLFIEAARENPRNVKVFNRLGVIYLEQKNFEDAIEAFSTAVKYDDKVCTRYYNLALAYIGQGSYKDAVKNLKEAIQLSPDNTKYKQVLEQIEKKC